MFIVTFLTSLFVFSGAQAFVHPGLLVAESDIRRATANIAASRAPWNASYAQLTDYTCASASDVPQAASAIYRGDDGVHTENINLMWDDAAAAFALALRWKLSGNVSYADAAARILTAWGNTLKTIGGTDDAYLAAGFQGHQFANAGELLRDYEPFVANGFDGFKAMMTSVFLPMNLDFLNHVLGSEHNVKHFFANWELGNLASAMAIAVLTDNSTLWDFSVEYFKSGEGNGCINNVVTNLVTEPDTGAVLGQGQESGRDQGHSALDWQMIGVIAQQAWNQGEDLYAYNDSRILNGVEYFARYNLGHEVDFEPYTNGIVSYSTISSASRGAMRPTWELLYSHYVQLKGMDAPWTTAYLNYSLTTYGGVEPGAGTSGSTSGTFDGLGWGSLLYHRDDNNTASSTNVISVITISSSTLRSSPSSAAPTTTILTTSTWRGATSNNTSAASPPSNTYPSEVVTFSASNFTSALGSPSLMPQSGVPSISSHAGKPAGSAQAHACHARRRNRA